MSLHKKIRILRKFDKLIRVALMLLVLFLIVMIIEMFLIEDLKKSYGYKPPLSLVIAMISMILLIILGHNNQKKIDKTQQLINIANARESNRDSFLLLRSFNNTSHQFQNFSGGPANPSPNAFVGGLIVEPLVKALSSIGHLLLVGVNEYDPIDSEHTIIIYSSDQNWRNVINTAILGCRAILIIPERTSGLLEEIKLLIDMNYLSKTIFIMNGSTGRDNRDEIWENIRLEYLDSSIVLPKFNKEGMLFMLDNNLNYINIKPLYIPKKKKLEESLEVTLKEIINQLPKAEKTKTLLPHF